MKEPMVIEAHGRKWSVTDRSFTTPGHDPTYMQVFVFERNNKHEYTIKEFFGDWSLYDAVTEERIGPCGPLSKLEPFLLRRKLPSAEQLCEAIDARNEAKASCEDYDHLFYGHA